MLSKKTTTKKKKKEKERRQEFEPARFIVVVESDISALRQQRRKAEYKWPKKEGRKEGRIRVVHDTSELASQQLFPSTCGKLRACYARLEACNARCRILART
ncbi:hypothetical protein K0M31_002384 [Melipona bicolor]|uniref:Uncharacterized protein n=1 Tax=Melipona bicolor TaxID=60889 RepID=A0AA40GIH4_9HYME|nr:hypothetical protein K0M31_002384 [Melipona bicolor]